MARNLQDAFFQKAKNDGIPVSVYLLSGFRISGIIKGFDTFTVLIEQQEGGTQLIYKHSKWWKELDNIWSFFLFRQTKTESRRKRSKRRS